MCLSETYLNHDTLFVNDNLWIPGYKLIMVDHPSNQKRGGICIYHKDLLPIKVNNISCFKECLNFNLSVHGKQYNYLDLLFTKSIIRSVSHILIKF